MTEKVQRGGRGGREKGGNERVGDRGGGGKAGSSDPAKDISQQSLIVLDKRATLSVEYSMTLTWWGVCCCGAERVTTGDNRFP